MAETPFVSPWAEPAAPPPAPTPAPPQGSRTQTIIVGLISTALLAAWLSWGLGWIWGVAAVFGVFVHEFGHLMVINAMGFGPSRIRIIPFFGGAATMPRTPDTDFKGVVIALSGPVFGLTAALPFFIASDLTHDTKWLGGAFIIAFFNLMNLAPAPPLDGSKALGPSLARIHPLVERGVLAGIGLAAVLWLISQASFRQPTSFILPVFIGLSVMASLRNPNLRPNARPLSWLEWAAALALYFAALVVCLGVMLVALPGAGLAAPMLHLGGSGPAS